MVRILFFFSKNCQFCHKAEAVLDRIAGIAGAEVKKIDIDTEDGVKLAEMHKIKYLPTTIIFLNDMTVKLEGFNGERYTSELSKHLLSKEKAEISFMLSRIIDLEKEKKEIEQKLLKLASKYKLTVDLDNLKVTDWGELK